MTDSDSVVDRGPWKVVQLDDGRLALGSDDFRHDVWLYVNGDFADKQQRLRYAETLVAQLNRARAEQERDVKAEEASEIKAGVDFIMHGPGADLGTRRIPDDETDYLPPDWEHPNWSEYRKTHCWRNHVGEEVIVLWETFSLTQKRALAKHAEELASAEEWE